MVGNSSTPSKYTHQTQPTNTCQAHTHQTHPPCSLNIPHTPAKHTHTVYQTPFKEHLTGCQIHQTTRKVHLSKVSSKPLAKHICQRYPTNTQCAHRYWYSPNDPAEYIHQIHVPTKQLVQQTHERYSSNTSSKGTHQTHPAKIPTEHTRWANNAINLVKNRSFVLQSQTTPEPILNFNQV